MGNIDEKLAKLNMQQRIENEKLEEEKLENNNEEPEMNLNEVMKGMEEGTLIINNNKYVFKTCDYLNNKINVPIPIVFFEERVNEKDNVILVNDLHGISLNVTHVEKGMKKQSIKEIKAGINSSYKKMKMYIKWLDEGSFEKDGTKILYASYKTPTANGYLYNLIFYRNVKGEAIVGNYNCFYKDIKDWKAIINASVRLISFR